MASDKLNVTLSKIQILEKQLHESSMGKHKAKEIVYVKEGSSTSAPPTIKENVQKKGKF